MAEESAKEVKLERRVCRGAQVVVNKNPDQKEKCLQALSDLEGKHSTSRGSLEHSIVS